jgi:hypothetical protein
MFNANSTLCKPLPWPELAPFPHVKHLHISLLQMRKRNLLNIAYVK